MVKDVVVDNLVQPDFTFNDACINDTVYLSNTSAGLAPGTTSVFELGDGNIASNQNNVAHVYAASGGYQVRLALEYGQDCKYEVKHQVQVYPLPKVGFNLDPPTADILNSDITVLDQSQGAVSYRYIISDGNEFTTPGFVYHFSDSGDYTITQILTSSFGCIDSISKTLHINYMVNVLMPSAFSPNNDLINDVFAPGGVGMTQYRMEIFNRWGEKIYDAENGSWNGENAMVGIYVYVVRLVDYNGRVHHLSGTINLLK
jgi:gliding motility-associated-like protein